jgi:hypothetical protein
VLVDFENKFNSRRPMMRNVLPYQVVENLMPPIFRRLLTFLVTVVTVMGARSTPAMHAEFRDAAGNFAYSEEFLRDYADALSDIANAGSAAPLHQLLER